MYAVPVLTGRKVVDGFLVSLGLGSSGPSVRVISFLYRRSTLRCVATMSAAGTGASLPACCPHHVIVLLTMGVVLRVSVVMMLVRTLVLPMAMLWRCRSKISTVANLIPS
eukprot:Rmarinus@m.28271